MSAGQAVVRGLVLDVDSTLYPMLPLLCRAMRRQFGIAARPEQALEWHFMLGLGLTTEQATAVVEACQTERAIMAVRPYPGAVEAVQRWRGAGVAIHVVSHRPARTSAITARWLAKIGLAYDALVIGATVDKLEYARQHRLSAIIDDKPSLIRAASSAGLLVGAIRHPYHAGLAAPNIVLADDWPTLARQLEERAHFGALRRPRAA